MLILDSKAGWEPPFKLRKAALELADRLNQLGTFPQQVKGLWCCRLPWMGSDGTSRRLPCRLRFCPLCKTAWRSEMKRTWGPKIAAISGSGGEVAAVTLTRGLHSGSLTEQKQALRMAIAKLFDRSAWKRKRGFMHRVGLLLVVEIGAGGMHDGQPHAHLLVVGSKPGVAFAAGEWMRDTWLELNPDARLPGQDVSLCSGPQDFGAWLTYILTGCTLDPLWDDERLEATAQALMDRSHRLTSYGLLNARKGRPNRKRRVWLKSNSMPSGPISFGHGGVDTD